MTSAPANIGREGTGIGWDFWTTAGIKGNNFCNNGFIWTPTKMAFLILILVPMPVINMAIVDILSHKIKKRKLDSENKDE